MVEGVEVSRIDGSLFPLFGSPSGHKKRPHEAVFFFGAQGGREPALAVHLSPLRCI
jgi:hypothetical protein